MSYTSGLLPVNATSYGQPFMCPGSRFVQLTVLNAAVEIQVGLGASGVQWQAGDSFRIPGSHTVPGPVDAIRVRSKTTHAGTTADPWPQISIDAY